MRVAIVHGYFLGDSGSAIYARELSRELTQSGHDVTLICQERQPEDYDFIDSLFDFNADNSQTVAVFEREPLYAGRCRLVRPNIGGKLLTYVAGPFPPFEAVPFQDATDDRVQAYIEANHRAMTVAFDRWPQDLVQANHAVMQPSLVREALRGRAPYVVTIHGSELNFTVKKDPRMVPYMAAGLAGAAAVVALSETSRDEVAGMAAAGGIGISGKTVVVSPGVDTHLFRPVADRAPVLKAIGAGIDPRLDGIAVFAGRLLWTKGLQYVAAALPLILQEHPRFHLIVVGDGPMRPSLEKLVSELESGDIGAARDLAETDPELAGASGYGPVIPVLDRESELSYLETARNGLGGRIHFTGHLPHERLAPLFGVADLSLAPSVFPEAFGLVSIEALSAGALPIATYQTGLRAPLDLVCKMFGDGGFDRLVPGCDLTETLASLVIATLNSYPTRSQDFRKSLHRAAENFSWGTVARRYLEFARG